MHRHTTWATLLFGCAVGFGCAHTPQSTGWAPIAPADGADAAAQEWIDRVWTAMGVLPTYKTHGEVRFTWNFVEGDAVKKSQNIYWNRFQNRLRWEEEAKGGAWVAVRTDLAKHTGTAYATKKDEDDDAKAKADSGKPTPRPASLDAFVPLASSSFPPLEKAAYESFLVARRWWVGPLTLCDKGVHVQMSPDEPAPGDNTKDGKKFKVLHVTFDASNEAVAEKPGDQVWWLIDPDTALPVWMFLSQEGREGKSAWSQEGWQTVGAGLKLPTVHKEYGANVAIKFVDLQVSQQPSEELYFDTLR
jgi:hypothetical protein